MPSNLFSVDSEDEMQYIIAIAKGETPKPPVYDQPDVFQSRKRPGSPSERHQPPYKFTGRPDNHRDPNEKYFNFITFFIIYRLHQGCGI